jgi:chemotaxis protein histidine kinase CheA
MDDLYDRAQLALSLAQLAVRFLRRSTIEAAVLSDLIEIGDVKDPTVIDKLEHMAHKIHGSGTIFGFSAVSESAGEIERLVGCLKARHVSQETTILPHILPRLRKWSRQLTQDLEAALAQ